MARQTGLSYDTVARAERGVANPSTVDHLCRFYGITREQLDADEAPAFVSAAQPAPTTNGTHDKTPVDNGRSTERPAGLAPVPSEPPG